MMKLHPDLEALMPEPVAKVRSWTCGSYHRNYQLDWTGHAKEGETLFTATQMREAILAATERAAKVVESLQDHAEEKRAMAKFTAAQGRRVADAVARGNHWSTVNLFNVALKQAAAAIRGDGGQT